MVMKENHDDLYLALFLYKAVPLDLNLQFQKRLPMPQRALIGRQDNTWIQTTVTEPSQQGKFQESTSTLKLAPNYPSCTITVASCFSCEAPGHCCSSFGEFSHSFWSHDLVFSFIYFLLFFLIISACYISLICVSCVIYFYLSLPHFLPCCHFEWCQKGSSWFAQLP